MKSSLISLEKATIVITLASLLLLLATATATAAQAAPRKLRFAAASVQIRGHHSTRRLQQLDWSRSGPIYGNWCGLNHGGGPTVDAVDSCCMNHDNCYGSRGFGDCQCDLDIVNCMSAVDTSRIGQEQANLAKVGAVQYFNSVYNSRCVQAAPAPGYGSGAPSYSYDYSG
jgi:hypothetical protein